MKRWLVLSVTVLSALVMVGLMLSVSARASPGQQSLPLATTPLPHRLSDPLPVPTYPVFTATIIVEPDKTLGMVYDNFYVRVAITVSKGCHYPFYELRLAQVGEDAPIFWYISPITDTVGPGNETTSLWTTHFLYQRSSAVHLIFPPPRLPLPLHACIRLKRPHVGMNILA